MGLTRLLQRLRPALFNALTFRAGLLRADPPAPPATRPRQ